jgi:two-component system OmpR family response regulator
LNILIAEDNAVLAKGYALGLSHYGYTTTIAKDGAEAKAALVENTFDMVLLDIGLPKINGMEVLSMLRSVDTEICVLLVTARDADEDRIAGLDMGADDYLVKPVSVGELAARIRAHMRRAKTSTDGQLTYGKLKVNLNAHRATVDDVPLDLTKTEWLILVALMRNSGRVVSKKNLMQVTGADEEHASVNAIEVYMSRLRSKLEAYALKVRTVRGFGYMLE